jgi:hypothetical protein
VAIHAAFTKELSGSHYPDDRLLALLGHDSHLDVAFLNVKPLLLTLSINPQAPVSSCAFIIALLARPAIESLHHTPRGGGSGFSPISKFALTSGTRWRDCRSFLIESKEFAVISESFDSRTLSKMEIALDRACLPAGSDKHRVRRIIAGKILECAHGGDKTLSGITAAGVCRSDPTQ